MKKKSTITLVVIVMATNQTLFGQKTWIVEANSYVSVKTGESVPQVNSAIRSNINKIWSISGFFIAHKFFGKGFVGVGYHRDSTKIFDIKVGIQTPGIKPEIKPTFIYTQKRISVFTTLEIGKEFWYLGNVLFSTSRPNSKNKLEVGFEARRHNGIGSIVYFSHGIFSYWSGMLYDYEKERHQKLGLMFGLKTKL